MKQIASILRQSKLKETAPSDTRLPFQKIMIKMLFFTVFITSIISFAALPITHGFAQGAKDLDPQIRNTQILTKSLEVYWAAIKSRKETLSYNDVNVIACGRVIVALYEFGANNAETQTLLVKISNDQMAAFTHVPDWLTTLKGYREDLLKLTNPALGEEHLYGNQRGASLSSLAMIASLKLSSAENKK